MKSLTKEERCVVARRLFEALCAYYPNRYMISLTATSHSDQIAAINRPSNSTAWPVAKAHAP